MTFDRSKLVTSMDWRLAILYIDDQTEREEAAWASGFSCVNCGRCTAAMVDTKKNCRVCGEGLFRIESLVTEEELRAEAAPGGRAWKDEP